MPFVHWHGTFKVVSEELSNRYARLKTVFIGELVPALAAVDFVVEMRLPLKDNVFEEAALKYAGLSASPRRATS